MERDLSSRPLEECFAAHLFASLMMFCPEFRNVSYFRIGKFGRLFQIAKETGLTQQTVCRTKADPAGAEAALAVWEL